MESVAVALLNSYRNAVHELRVAEIAAGFGFADVTASATAAPRIKLIPRGDTAVLDAYLNPILGRYVASIRRALGRPDSTLRVMSSAGGLLPPERFTGKDSLLSGPAGGVVGLSRVARGAGYDSAIGFDMGGTSTDVTRIDRTRPGGALETQFEGVKAGVRFATPMLAIETVAAGGGSVCRFDGVKLQVGPESAGADPGPACYGRGGPLTVTDVNFFLGRILPAHFPFPLDRAAVAARLGELAAEVAGSAFGRDYQSAELAAGFRTIAVEAMARAIRAVSTAKGYDPAAEPLVVFGGAGGQHACDLARTLGMSTVVSPPHAGVLSAYGIGHAPVRRFAERPLPATLDPATSAEIDALAAALRYPLLAEVDAELPAGWASESRTLVDLRYAGTDAALTVDWARLDVASERFETVHEERFGYRREGREIELVAVRVVVTAAEPETATPRENAAAYAPEPAGATAMHCSGGIHTVPYFRREELRPRATIVGPAIVCEQAATFVVEPGWTAAGVGGGRFDRDRSCPAEFA